MRISIVGAGIVGLSAARSLAARGHKVVISEQFPLFHRQGSSHGTSRIVRKAYPDPFYTACMSDAYPLWSDLEACSMQSLLHEVGLAYYGDRDSMRVRSLIHGLMSMGVPHRVLNSSESEQVMPDLRLAANEVLVFTPEAGWVDAEKAMRATLQLAIHDGAEVRVEAIGDIELHARDFDVVVLTAGPWICRFIPVPVTVTKQTVAYLDFVQSGPVWIDDGRLTYGFPSDSQGLKVGAHPAGPEMDPEDLCRQPDPRHLELILETVQSRFGMGPEVRSSYGCLYTTTASEDFLLGRFGANGFFASACSGHGFKMGPWIGRLLADFCEGKDDPARYPRFFWSLPRINP